MTIVVAVDAEREDDPVISVAADLAEAFDDELVVLHVMPDGEFERRRTDHEYYVDDAARDAKRTARWVAEGSLGEDADVTALGRVGEPVETILSTADDHDARYVVIGGRKRTPVGKAIFGSVTQSVLLDAHRSVVTVMD